MNEEELTKFVKGPYSENGRSTYAKIVKRIPMGVGGGKGKAYDAEKSYVVLQFFPNKESGKKVLRRLTSKDYQYLDSPDVHEIIKAYDVARQDGFPVPTTTRYYETEDNEPAILTTDMTECNNFRVWGYNDNPTSKEDNILQEMNLTEGNLEEIKSQGESIVKLANEKRRSLGFQNFHIRQSYRKKDVEVFLLDLDENFLDPTYNLASDNNKALEEFMELLSTRPDQREDVLSKYRK